MSAKFAPVSRDEGLDGLVDRRLFRELAYVDGRWSANAESLSFPVTDPATGANVAWVASLDARETTGAIDAAQRAFPAWRAMLPRQRSAILRKWYELMLAARQDLALLMTLEQGKPLKESLGEID